MKCIELIALEKRSMNLFITQMYILKADNKTGIQETKFKV